ncbi:MAG: hypothetical protein BWK76_08645 [Desulfobulbaceae bacterium A2]|nr:MAG: hypothetical protein BWK76_08645 [Desulfobulbaceae bacterium A2]
MATNTPPHPALISLEQAREIIRAIPPLPREDVPLADAVGLVTAEDIHALSDCPSVDSSLKDGYAVIADDIRNASNAHPVSLDIHGTVTAGDHAAGPHVRPGTAVRIMSGAALPDGANAVLASEFAEERGGRVHALRDAHAGRNILPRGADVQLGSLVVETGTTLTPTHIGLLAAAGVAMASVHRRPRVAIVATGSELVSPGERITSGKVAASNLVTLAAELRLAGITAETVVIHDDLAHLRQRLAPLIAQHDAILTCGGVLDGDKDFTMQAMNDLRVEPLFRRVRVGPGKGICLGRKDATLICNLPGGPPSNHVAFILLALPALRRLAGHDDPFAGRKQATLTASVRGQTGWTQVVYARSDSNSPGMVTPLYDCGRLQAMAKADCLIELQENVTEILQGTTGTIWRIR